MTHSCCDVHVDSIVHVVDINSRSIGGEVFVEERQFEEFGQVHHIQTHLILSQLTV